MTRKVLEMLKIAPPQAPDRLLALLWAAEVA
jgi:hypothetical protein